MPDHALMNRKGKKEAQLKLLCIDRIISRLGKRHAE
jgi:hypothetical protein